MGTRKKEETLERRSVQVGGNGAAIDRRQILADAAKQRPDAGSAEAVPSATSVWLGFRHT